MPRATERYMAEAEKQAVSPITLVRLLDIPEIADPSVKHSLYLTDAEHDLTWFNEVHEPTAYSKCALKYTPVKVTTETPVSTATLTLVNVDRRFSALAQYVKLRGVEVHVYRGFSNLLDYEDGAQLLFLGHLEAPVFQDESGTSTIEAKIQADFSLQVEVPRRTYWVNDFPYLPAAKDVRKVYVG